jgi:hypothetical protein
MCRYRIEHVQEKSRDVLIHVQGAIPGPVTLTAGVHSFQQAGQNLEVLESLKLRFLDFFSFGTHEWHLNTTPGRAQ